MTREELEQIIANAIQDEIKSHDFYDSAAKKVVDTNIKEMFEKLAKEELGHKKFLEEFLESKAKVIELDAGEDYKISETFDRPELKTELNFLEAMQIAIKNEEDAMKKYQNLADACLRQEEKDLFLGLKDMEEMHKTRLEDVYVNVAYVEAW